MLWLNLLHQLGLAACQRGQVSCPEDQFALPLVDEMLAEWHTSLVVDILHNQDWRACSYSRGIKVYYHAHGKTELETEWQFGAVPAVLPAL